MAAVEAITRRPFKPFRPKPLFYREPQYYLGNASTLIADGAGVPWPSFTEALDFELELAAVVVAPVRDATPAEAEAAIGGFVVFNDLTARDVQWEEVRGGIFGPIAKSKSFASALGAEVVSADAVLPRARSLRGEVRVNGELWSATDTSDQRWTFPEMLAHASRGETVGPGELLSSGTLHDGCGLELDRWLRPGDDLRAVHRGRRLGSQPHRRAWLDLRAYGSPQVGRRLSTPKAARVGLAPQWPHFMPSTGTSTSRFPRYPRMLHRPG